ncbi:MAG: hypothetical protein FWF54_07370 [Candidatus Azobacteroides sp.]|nr:hypothetical protein [Candidatus Azobacteroides sp.]
MYSIKQFESALLAQKVLPGYEIFLGDKDAGMHRKYVRKATGYLEADGNLKLHCWNDKGECRLYYKDGERVPEHDLKFS